MNGDTLHIGELWDVPQRPSLEGREGLCVASRGALLVNAKGTIAAVGPGSDLKKTHPAVRVVDHGERILLPGMVDTHAHYPQLGVIGAPGVTLLDWLDHLTYPLETRFVDGDYAARAADRFATEMLANGTTFAAVYATSSKVSAEAMLDVAVKRGFRAIVGKVSMDQGAPAPLLIPVERDVRDVEDLIAKWHDKNTRVQCAITPRFALSCSEESLRALGEVATRHPSVYIQTHWAETKSEIAAVKARYPKALHYLGVYDDAKLVGKSTILGHGVHPSDAELVTLAQSGAAIAHCPTSNLGLGSGLFPLRELVRRNIRIGLATDVGGGSSLSLWRTMAAAYEIQQLRGEPVSPAFLLYLATLGGADALGMGDRLGSFKVGKCADFSVLDWRRSRMLKARFEESRDEKDRLASMLMLADDRLTERVYVDGREVFAT